MASCLFNPSASLTLLTWTKLQADGETTEFAGQVNKPNRHAETHAPVWLEGLMSCQRHLADSHPQFSLGEQRLDLLNHARGKLHHFCTVSAPLVRLRVVQFFVRGVSGGPVHLLDYRFQLGYELAAVFTFRLATTDHGTVEDLRGQPRESAAGAHGTVEGGQRLGEIVDARATAHPAHRAPTAAARERTAETTIQAKSE